MNTNHGRNMEKNPMSDDHTPDPLDQLLSAARQIGPEDEGAAEHFLATHRAARARPRPRLIAWAAPLLAGAAMLGGLVYLNQNRALPTSAAYEAYQQASGSGW